MEDKQQLLAQGASRTLDDFFDRVGIKSKHNIMHFTVMCLAALITGLNIMSSVFVNVLLKLNDEWRVTLADWQYSLLSSLFFLGNLIKLSAQLTKYLGFFIGDGVFGWLSDAKGRRLSFWLAFAFMSIFSSLSSIFPVYWILAISRLITGIGVGGFGTIYFVISIEYCGSKLRPYASPILSSTFALGGVLGAIIAWGTQDWRLYLIIVSAINFLMLVAVKFVAESPLWLLSNGRVDEASKIMQWVVNFSKSDVPQSYIDEVIAQSVTKQAGKPEHVSFKALLKRQYITRLGLLCFIWFTTSGVYYGLSFNSTELSGNVYLNAALSSAIEIPAYVVAGYITERLGRKLSVILTMATAGVGCLVLASLLQAGVTTYAALLCGALLGKAGIAAEYAIIYTFTAELFPTNVRTLAIGVCSQAARIAGLSFPYLFLSAYHTVPPFIFGGTALLSAIVAFWLKETKNAVLAQ